MREILFRGKVVGSLKWVEGFYYVKRHRYAGDKEFISEEHMITTGIVEASGGYGERVEDIEYSVIPETIGQYTGLTDKNDKKIFEGDIVKSDGYIFVVNFGKCGGVANTENYGYMGFYFNGCDKVTKDCIGYGLRNDMCYFTEREVIGNIHDNPELLKGGEG